MGLLDLFTAPAPYDLKLTTPAVKTGGLVPRNVHRFLDLVLILRDFNIYPLIAGFDIKFLLVKITMKFPFFRFLELRNEFYSIDLPHVACRVFLVYHPTKTRPTFSLALHHFLFLSSPAFVATFENGQYTW